MRVSAGPAARRMVASYPCTSLFRYQMSRLLRMALSTDVIVTTGTTIVRGVPPSVPSFQGFTIDGSPKLAESPPL